MSMSEEQAIISVDLKGSSDYIKAYNRIPYALITQETKGSDSKSIVAELTKIFEYYQIYNKGAKFATEGTNGDYIPSNLNYKLVASLINKEARFLFAESPDITVESKGDVGTVSQESKDALTVLNDLITTVLDVNNFEEILIKAAKDCFIGKRVAGLVNFNEEDGITITFIPSTQFIFETKSNNSNIIEKFVCFINENSVNALGERRIFKKKYELVDGKVYLEEIRYDGAGTLIEVVTEYQETLLDLIPVAIFINDGLTGDVNGESEVAKIHEYESYYSKLSNADMDAERKSMNPIKYTIDMSDRSTKNLPTGAGAYWDLQTDQALDARNNSVGNVGVLESSMQYSQALQTTLDRIKSSGYDELDMPDVTLDTMSGAITSGKALKAIYWPLIVRCKEKMKTWGPNLRKLIDIVIQGAMVYPNTVIMYLNDPIVPVAYKIDIVQNHPLPEDELEEKTSDLAEVQYKTMSRKAYMQKWRYLTDEQVQEELEQIAIERQLIEDSTFESTGF